MLCGPRLAIEAGWLQSNILGVSRNLRSAIAAIVGLRGPRDAKMGGPSDDAVQSRSNPRELYAGLSTRNNQPRRRETPFAIEARLKVLRRNAN
jgi:hypothetical protein